MYLYKESLIVISTYFYNYDIYLVIIRIFCSYTLISARGMNSETCEACIFGCIMVLEP